MAEYLVLKRERCPRCDGCGIVPHPIWSQCWQEWKKTDRSMHFMDFAEKWLADKVVDGAPALEAPQELVCPECDGFEVLERRVPLQEALREIRWPDAGGTDP